MNNQTLVIYTCDDLSFSIHFGNQIKIENYVKIVEGWRFIHELGQNRTNRVEEEAPASISEYAGFGSGEAQG